MKEDCKISKFDVYNSNAINQAITELEKSKSKIARKLTKNLRRKYKGKKVKCSCFDSYTDGDEYYFDDKLLDISAYPCINEDEFHIRVTFNYKSIFGGKKKPHSFYLESIEKVK